MSALPLIPNQSRPRFASEQSRHLRSAHLANLLPGDMSPQRSSGPSRSNFQPEALSDITVAYEPFDGSVELPIRRVHAALPGQPIFGRWFVLRFGRGATRKVNLINSTVDQDHPKRNLSRLPTDASRYRFRSTVFRSSCSSSTFPSDSSTIMSGNGLPEEGPPRNFATTSSRMLEPSTSRIET